MWKAYFEGYLCTELTHLESPALRGTLRVTVICCLRERKEDLALLVFPLSLGDPEGAWERDFDGWERSRDAQKEASTGGPPLGN